MPFGSKNVPILKKQIWRHTLNSAPCGSMHGRKSLIQQPHDGDGGSGKTAVVT